MEENPLLSLKMQTLNIHRIQGLRAIPGGIRSQSVPVPPAPTKRRKTRRFRSSTPDDHSIAKNKCFFDIIGVINNGICNFVYKIRKTSSKKCYAMKASKNNLAAHHLSEVSILQKLQTKPNDSFYHVNICKFRMFYVYQQSLHQIYEYYPLGTLKRLVQNQGKRLNPLQIVEILAQVANGLSYIHSKNIIHLDLKPENICVEMYNADLYILKIADFGIALDIDYYAIHKLPLRLPSGDAVYISPEVLHQINNVFDVKQSEYLKNTDIFSLGIIAIELIQDIRLPPGGPIFTVLRNIDKKSNHRIRWHYLVNNNAPQTEDLVLKTLKQIVNDMVYSNPMHRPSSKQLLDVILKSFASEKKNCWKEFMKLQIPQEIKTTRNIDLPATITYDVDKFNKIPARFNRSIRSTICDF